MWPLKRETPEERWYREIADLRADADEERDPDKARALRETADRLDRDPENPRNRSDHKATHEDTRSAPPEFTDAQVEHMDQAVERAFRERDRLWDVYRETGRAEDERAMERQDEHAARLLDRYNAAVAAQYAEVDRRRSRSQGNAEQEQIDRDMAKDAGGTFVDMPPPAEPPAKDTDTPDPVDEAERIVRRADEVEAYYNGSTPPGRTIHGPDGTTPIGTYQTVDNGDGTTVMQRMTLHGWRNLPETRANNGRPPRPRQTTSQTATSGGAMASIEEVKAGINQSNDTASNSLGALQQAASDVEQAQQMLMQAVEGSGQNDQQEALALYAQALESINEAQQGVQMATQSAEQVAGRL